jgi:hypothetical protein
MRSELHQGEIQRLLRQAPFQRFILILESGDRVLIEHPENIAFDPTPGGRADFYVLGGQVRFYSTFDAISNIAMFDAGAPVA